MKTPYTSFDVEATGLNSGAHIISIGSATTHKTGEPAEGNIWSVQDWVEHPETGERTPTAEEETRVITKFVEHLEQHNGPFYSFNGSGYDLPLLWNLSRRAQDYGKLARRIENLIGRHIDLLTILNNRGEYGGLDKMLDKYGIEHKSDLSGEKVPEYFNNGKVSEIEVYLQEDVRTTHELVKKVIR